MKQVSSLPILGKKMNKEAMKALKGGRAAQGCVEVGWACSSNCCYETLWECRSNCMFECSLSECLV